MNPLSRLLITLTTSLGCIGLATTISDQVRSIYIYRAKDYIEIPAVNIITMLACLLCVCLPWYVLACCVLYAPPRLHVSVPCC